MPWHPGTGHLEGLLRMAASPSDAAGAATAVAAGDPGKCANPHCVETAKPEWNPFCSIDCGRFYWYNQSLLLRNQEDGQPDQVSGALVHRGGSGGGSSIHNRSCDRGRGRSRSHSRDEEDKRKPVRVLTREVRADEGHDTGEAFS